MHIKDGLDINAAYKKAIAFSPNGIDWDFIDKEAIAKISKVFIPNVTSSVLNAGRKHANASVIDILLKDGSNVTFDVHNVINQPTWSVQSQGAPDAIAIVSGGTGYTSAVGVATTGGSGTGLTVDTTDTGVPATISAIGGANTAYNTAAGVATAGGTGAGLTVNITCGGGPGTPITAVAIATPGTGYTVGDVITVNVDSADATFTILTITGVLGAAVINTAGTDYVVGDVVTVTGGGANATVEITSLVSAVTDQAGLNKAVADIETWRST